MFRTWFSLAALAVETQEVVWLRSLALASGGPGGNREAMRMVAEKFDASFDAGMQLALGATHDAVIRGYRKKVLANKRRLSPRKPRA